MAALTPWTEAVLGDVTGAASAPSSLFLCTALRIIFFFKSVVSSLMKREKLLNIAIL